MFKTIVLARRVEDRVHLTQIRGEVPLHIDLVDKIINRCVQRGVSVDCDTLIDSVIAKGIEI